MRHLLKLSLPALLTALLLAACGSGGGSAGGKASSGGKAGNSGGNAASTQSSGGSGTVVKTGSSSLGTVLVDSEGMTLYALSAERNGKFICTTSACLGTWHPLTVPAGSTPKGEVSSLSTIKRPEGTTQVTYKGEPLYTFAQDTKPGETNGEGFKDVGTWAAVTTSAASSKGTAPSKSGGSSGSSSGEEGAYSYGEEGSYKY